MESEKQQIEENIEEPLDNFQIKEILPYARIMTNKELNNINHIDELFDKSKFCDFIILLFLDGPNKGHWVSLSRYGPIENPIECFVEFFDSYGGNVKKVYSYCPMEIRKQLGTEKDKLNDLLKKCDYNVIYNPIKYQLPKKDVNTCGRHCAYRIKQLVENGRDLPEYYDLMNYLKKKENMDYDEIVAKNIDV